MISLKVLAKTLVDKFQLQDFIDDLTTISAELDTKPKGAKEYISNTPTIDTSSKIGLYTFDTIPGDWTFGAGQVPAIVADADATGGTTNTIILGVPANNLTLNGDFTLITTEFKFLNVRYHLESENNYDWFKIFVNGVEVYKVSGIKAWEEVNVPIPIGTNAISLRYSKDSSDLSGYDNVRIGSLALYNGIPSPISYNIGDMVIYNSNIFIATAQNPLTAPITGVGWSKIVNGVEGGFTVASGLYSHAEGSYTYATGDSSHTEGNNNTASGTNSHTEGNATKAIGINSHAEGDATTANSYAAHAEGVNTYAAGYSSHAEGRSSLAAFTSTLYPITLIVGLTYTVTGDISGISVGNTVIIVDYANGSRPSKVTAVNGQTITTDYGNGGATYLYKLDATHGYGEHAEGMATLASGYSSHAEGKYASATGEQAHAEGLSTLSQGKASHAEGISNSANGEASHSEGKYTSATGIGAHAEGSSTNALGNSSHTEGDSTSATGVSSHAEGSGNKSYAPYAHSEGSNSISCSQGSHAEGNQNIAGGGTSYAINAFSGQTITLSGTPTWVIGDVIYISWTGTSAQKLTITNITANVVTVSGATPTGSWTFASKANSTDSAHAEGFNTTAFGNNSHAEGAYSKAIGDSTHAEGSNTMARVFGAHAEGFYTLADSGYCHAEGAYTLASSGTLYKVTAADNAAKTITVDTVTGLSIGDTITLKAFGLTSTVLAKITAINGLVVTIETTVTLGSNHVYAVKIGSTYASHAEGDNTIATGQNSHAEGYYTLAQGQYQTVIGRLNVPSGTYNGYQYTDKAFIIGNGSSNAARSNAFDVDWNGDVLARKFNGQSMKNNCSVSSQSIPATTRTYVAGTKLQFPAGGLAVGTRFKWGFSMTKTAAGSVSSTIDIAIGTAGTTADTSRITFVKPAGNAVVDEGWVDIDAIVRSVGASCVISGTIRIGHNLSATGHLLIPFSVSTLASSSFDVSTATNIGVCMTTGTNDAITIQTATAEAFNV